MLFSPLSAMDRRIRTLVAAPHRLYGMKKNVNIASRTRDVIAKTAFGLESIKFLVHRAAELSRKKKRRRPCPPPNPLPAELWIEIIEQHATCDEWIALSKTCWFFHHIAQPCLYKSATVGRYFSPTTLDESSLATSSSLSVFTKTIHRRPDLGTFVRELTIHSPSRAVSREHEVLHGTPTGSGWFVCFPNLEKIRVTKYWLTPEFCTALRLLPRLRVAQYEHCRVDGDLLAAYLQHYPRCAPSEVEITIPYIFKASAFPNAWTCVIPAGVQSLKLHTPGNPKYLDLMMSSIMLMGSNGRLTTLSIGTSYLPNRRSIHGLPAALIDFLVSSPQLRRLEINFWTSDPSFLTSLPADALPLLEDFTGPPAFFDIFLRGRPVHRVGAFFDLRAENSVDAESLKPLALSSVPVTELALDIGLLFSDMDDIGECLMHAPVSVRRLKWSYVFAVDLVAWLPVLSRLKNLHEISGLWNYKLTLEEIVQISEACPSLCEIYTDRHVWVRRGQDDEAWDRFSVEAATR